MPGPCSFDSNRDTGDESPGDESGVTPKRNRSVVHQGEWNSREQIGAIEAETRAKLLRNAAVWGADPPR